VFPSGLWGYPTSTPRRPAGVGFDTLPCVRGVGAWAGGGVPEERGVGGPGGAAGGPRGGRPHEGREARGHPAVGTFGRWGIGSRMAVC